MKKISIIFYVLWLLVIIIGAYFGSQVSETFRYTVGFVAGATAQMLIMLAGEFRKNE